jgi:putative FmdB family regulatory protein
MPIYEYKCSECHNRRYIKHSYSENPDIRCSNCNGKMKIVIDPSPVIFKGTGFYCTDNKNTSN